MKRALKNSGSLWLNIGNIYDNHSLVLLGAIIVNSLISRQHWILVNDIVWRKTTSLLSSYKRRLSNTYEHIYHLVKDKKYYLNQNAFRNYKKKTNIEKSLSGVTGKRYVRRIKDSLFLDDEQKKHTFDAVNSALLEIENGTFCDFRLLLKGDNSIVNGPNSNRAKEIEKAGFIILRYSDYSMLGDVWDIAPNKKAYTILHFQKNYAYIQ